VYPTSKKKIVLLTLISASAIFGTGCGDTAEGEPASGSSLDSALMGEWWETYHVYSTTDVGPMFRWTFNSNGSGQMICSTELAGDACNGAEIMLFDWSVPSAGNLETDQRPRSDGTDFGPEQWSYAVAGDAVEMTNYDGLDNLTTLRLSRFAPSTGTTTCEGGTPLGTITAEAAFEVATGISVAAGDRIQFLADGTWCWGGDCPDADGTAGRPLPDELPVAVEGASFGTLGGRVGSSYFAIGSCSTVTMSEAGELYLLMSDRVGYYSDNSGAIQVQVARE
jgi:hypothetical protein